MRRPVIATPPAAGFWHRYAAWSLDAALLSALVPAFTWPRVSAAWQALGASAKAAVSGAGAALADAMMAGITLPALPDVLLADPRLAAAASAMESALWQLCWPLLLGYALLAAPWHVLGERSRWRGSPGKRAFGIEVVDLHGDTLAPARVAGRHLASLLSWLTLNLGHLLAAVPPRRQSLHDRIAGARVVVRGDARMPAGARLWIALQLVALSGAIAWWMLRYIAALEAALPAL